MKNRAKCKLCKSIIESFHDTDYVRCSCGEIYVDGGNAFRCGATDWDNFLRVDEKGNEIAIKVEKNISSKPTKHDLLKMLDEMITSYEGLPPQAMINPITHYDFLSALLLLSSILKGSLKEDN